MRNFVNRITVYLCKTSDSWRVCYDIDIVNMRKSAIAFDTKIRLVSASCLVLGILFTIVGFSNRTISTFFLWVALICGVIALIGAFAGKRSWYSGVVILLATYLFFIFRNSPDQWLKNISTIVALLAGLGGITNEYIGKSFGKSLFKYK